MADDVERSLDPAWVDLQRVVYWIAWGVFVSALLVVVLVLVFASGKPAWQNALIVAVWISAALVFAWAAQRWPAVEYRFFRYRVGAEGIHIRAGVVWRSVASVPRSRVQHIDVAQGPIERRYGLASLSIYTAGTEFAKIDLPGLRYPLAVQLRDHLLPGRDHAEDDGT